MIEVKLLQNTNRKPLLPFQIPSLRTVHSVPQRRYIDDVIFGLHENLIISETVYESSMIDDPSRICQEKLCIAPPSGYSTMTSVPVCKNTSLFRKRCMIEIKLLLNTKRKPVFPIQIPSLRTGHSAPQRKYIDDVIFGLQENLLISETVYDRRKMSEEQNQETLVVIENCVQRSLADIAP